MRARPLAPTSDPRPSLAAAATGAALAYLASALWMPALLPLVCVALVAAHCALPILRRPSRRLRRAVALTVTLVCLPFVGLVLVPLTPMAGFLWLLGTLFLLPLPLVPWLYAASFEERDP